MPRGPDDQGGLHKEQLAMNSLASFGNVLVALLFAGVYCLCYVEFLNPVFAYAGYPLEPRDLSFVVASTAIAVAPILAYRGIRAVSSVISVFIYLLLYVPIVLTFALGSPLPLGRIVAIQLTFMASMCALFLTDAVIIKNPIVLSTRHNVARMALGVTIVGALYVVSVYRTSLAFVSFADVYVQRFATTDIGTDVVTRYLSAWLSSVLVPICLAYGLVRRKHIYVIVATATCVVFYMAVALKIMILLPVVFAGFYAVFAKRRLAVLFPTMAIGLSVIALILIAVTNQNNGVPFLATGLFLSRTLGNGGQLTMAYYDFFATHPQTAYTHVHGITQLMGSYPYGSLSLGEVVGQFYWSSDMDANANFWATDGFAAAGLIGVPFATALCALTMALMNSVTERFDRLFAAMCFLPFIISLLNRSLFSSVWSGGAAFAILFFLTTRPENELSVRLPSAALPFEQRPFRRDKAALMSMMTKPAEG